MNARCPASPARRTWTISTRLQSSRLLLCRGNRRFSSGVACQSQHPQPRGLFTHGQMGCLVFGHCFLTVLQPLFLLLENRIGSIACLMSVDIQRRYSFFWRIHPTGQTFLGTGCRLPMWGWSTEPTPFQVICSTPRPVLILSPWPCNVSQNSALPLQACSDEMHLTMIIPPFGSPCGLKVYTCPKCGRSESYLVTVRSKAA